jgi:hypothetical protein
MEGWSADQEQPLADFGLLPKGWYAGYVESTERKESKGSPGNHYLNATIVSTDESAPGRKFWPMFFLWYQKQDTVIRARREFGSLCRATGRIAPKNTDEIHKIPIGFYLSHSKDSNGEIVNKVTNYCTEADLSKKKASQPKQKPAGNPMTQQAATWNNSQPQQPAPAPAPPAFQMQPPAETPPQPDPAMDADPNDFGF